MKIRTKAKRFDSIVWAASLNCVLGSSRCGLSVKPEMPAGSKSEHPENQAMSLSCTARATRLRLRSRSNDLPPPSQVGWLGIRRALAPSGSEHGSRCRTGPGSNVHPLDASPEVGDLPHSHLKSRWLLRCSRRTPLARERGEHPSPGRLTRNATILQKPRLRRRSPATPLAGQRDSG